MSALKTLAKLVFWGFIIFAGIRYLNSAGVTAWRERLICTYKDLNGNCLSEDEHIRRIAHDAATDAINDWIAECSGIYSSTNPNCAAFHQK